MTWLSLLATVAPVILAAAGVRDLLSNDARDAEETYLQGVLRSLEAPGPTIFEVPPSTSTRPGE